MTGPIRRTILTRALSVVAALTPQRKSTAVSPAPTLTDPLPRDWRGWRGDQLRTFGDLVDKMAVEASIDTCSHTVHETSVTLAEARFLESPRSSAAWDDLDTAQVHRLGAVAHQAVLLGWALRDTYEEAGSDIDRWYALALARAGLTRPSEDDERAIYAALERATALYNRLDQRWWGK